MPTSAQAVRLEPQPEISADAIQQSAPAKPLQEPRPETRPETVQKNVEPEGATVQPEYVGKKKGRGNAAAIIAAVVILLLAGGVTIWLAQKWQKDQQANASPDTGKAPPTSDASGKQREQWLREGWKTDASSVLAAFTNAKSPEERMKHVIPNDGVMDELKLYYSGGKDDVDTPADSFVHIMGTAQDRERGIFLMQYRQPAQINIREYFAPIGSLEAIMGQQETSLLEMAHRIDEDNLSDPIGINAFFKEIDGELKLDASVFIQGKWRTFKLFTSYPQPGKSKMFRVVASESLSHHYRDNPNVRTYRFEDFAYPKDFVSLPVKVDSESGEILSQLNWHGENKDLIYKTATVELEWTDDRPSKLQVKRLVCWEFLGVGGEIGNTTPASPEKPSPEGAE
ncbi:MAG: hypothetical protein AB8F34_01090 [Akkermansiaceae bacterium]